jgi:hypothetical protein
MTQVESTTLAAFAYDDAVGLLQLIAVQITRLTAGRSSGWRRR